MELLYTAVVETSIGALQLVSSERGLAYVELPNASGRGFEGWRKRHAPDSRVEEAYTPNRSAGVQLLEYLEGKRTDFELALDLRATPFQRGVYECLREIAYGETQSYADVARRLGQPRALRAVGAANGANPIPLVIPCHRVVAAHHKLGGYGGGLPLKRRLLAMESTRPGDGRFL